MSETPEDDLQFEQAEYGEQAASAAQACSACGGPLQGEYFLANGHVVCGNCVAQLNAARDAGSPLGRFGLAILGGLLAGALGAGLYFGIAELTGYEFGLVAIVVGFAVGAAVRWGSGGRGGLPYQLLAVFITYAAIVLTYVPAIVAGFNASVEQSAILETDPQKVARVTVMRDQSVRLNGSASSMQAVDVELARVSAVSGQAWYHREGMAEEAPGATADEVADLFEKHGLEMIPFTDQSFQSRESWFEMVRRADVSQQLMVAGMLFGFAVMAPFLSLPANIIGILIIAFALFQAWRSNRRAVIDIQGPLQIAEQPPG